MTNRFSKGAVHDFYIPVMGTAFTIDTPIKVARFGISSVVSIVDDELCEEMRLFYCKQYNLACDPIEKFSVDYRARRITQYLNLLSWIVDGQISDMKAQPFDKTSDLTRYFQLLNEHHPMKQIYLKMLDSTGDERAQMETQLRNFVKPGDIEVNIMTKVDRDGYDQANQPLPTEYSDACASLRGFANSDLRSSVVFSAGFNRRLYAYIEDFSDFYPDETGEIKKKIILKVSDFRSSQTQGRFLAKKGIWVSEFRIESGLNCGGHAFATDGFLMGPILDEFRVKRRELSSELFDIVNESLAKKGLPLYQKEPATRFTVQGGIGTREENEFLFNHYGVDATGWASPFLLVPEATTLDMPTRELLAKSKRSDFYLSGISPLGVPFNTVKGSESEIFKYERVESGRPGSPCPKGHLVSNTTYSKKPVCLAAQFYQKRALSDINQADIDDHERIAKTELVVRKACLCEDLASAALKVNGIDNGRPLKTAVCPGPNLAYFDRLASLGEMIGHIYGVLNLLSDQYRPHMFAAELKMYIDYLRKEITSVGPNPDNMKLKYVQAFKNNLLEGINYYSELIPEIVKRSNQFQSALLADMERLKMELEELIQSHSGLFTELTVTRTPAA